MNSGIGRGSSIWILLIALGGIFTDAYDLTSFGIGVPQLREQMHLSPAAIGTVSAAISFGAVIGALIGGYYVDKIGRLRMFLLDLVCFVIAAIGAAFSTNIWMLIVFRVLMGFGLGLDYPVALSFVAEYTATKRKSSNVGYWIIASSTCYVIFYLLVVLPLYLTGAGPNLWRWAVGLGAVPALIVLILRYIHMRESPMWAALQGDLNGAARILEKSYGVANIRVDPDPQQIAAQASRGYSLKDYAKIFSPRYLRRTVLASIINPLQSMEFFAVIFYLPSISLLIFGKDFIHAILGSAFFNAFGIFGGIIAVYAMPRFGLQRLMKATLVVVALSLIVLGLAGGGLPAYLAAALIGIFICAHQAGVGQGGMTMATLSYPTSIRGAGTGWNQAILRVGSLLGFYFFPLVLASVGLNKTLLILAIVPIVMLVANMFIRWEPVAKDIDAEDFVDAEHAVQPA